MMQTIASMVIITSYLIITGQDKLKYAKIKVEDKIGAYYNSDDRDLYIYSDNIF